MAYPDARIVLALHPVNAGLAEQLPFFDQLLQIPSGALSGWRNKWTWVRQVKALKPDMAFCCSGGTAWPFVLAMSGIPKRMGVTPNFGGSSTRFAQRLWTDRVLHDGSQLIGSTYVRLLSLAGITHIDETKLVCAAPGADSRVDNFLTGAGHSPQFRLVGVAISAANKLKELGQPLLEAVCGKLLAEDSKLLVVLLGGPGDKPLAAALTKTLVSPRVIDSCGIFELAEVPALLRRLDVFVGVDSGLTYMADALEIPLVSMAGPCNMQETRPINKRAVILQEKLPCVPCAHIFNAPYACRIGTRSCITSLQADAVAGEALRLLAESGLDRA